MLPLSQLMSTHTQVLVMQKPAGGSNSAKAHLLKFVMTLDFLKRERERLKVRPLSKLRAVP